MIGNIKMGKVKVNSLTVIHLRFAINLSSFSLLCTLFQQVFYADVSNLLCSLFH